MAPSACAMALMDEDVVTGMAALSDILRLGAIITGVIMFGLKGHNTLDFENALQIVSSVRAVTCAQP